MALFVQGCDFHCRGCFNAETWNFDGGTQWNKIIQNDFLDMASRAYIKRISILGGEPLHNQNVVEVCDLCKMLKEKFPQKTIWLYTGYNFEDCFIPEEAGLGTDKYKQLRNEVLKHIDILVDGRFIQELADINYPFAGSTNQKVIDVQKSIKHQKIILYKP